MTLQRAATLPDEIKSWQCGREPSGSNRINRELQAFVNANCSHPSHSEFHYTDVPVAGNENYADGEVGRFEFDIVKMIPFCIRVLKGEAPEVAGDWRLYSNKSFSKSHPQITQIKALDRMNKIFRISKILIIRYESCSS